MTQRNTKTAILRPPHSRGNIVLACLRAADCISRRAAKVGGPRKPGSQLGQSEDGIETGDDLVAAALDHLEAVRQIGDPAVRAVISLAMATGPGCVPVHNRRSLAATVALPLSTAHRLLQRGLDQVAGMLPIYEEMRKAA
jgi:hypothetical protein